MNVGMVIAFFAALRGTPDEPRFAALQGVLEASLGPHPRLERCHRITGSARSSTSITAMSSAFRATGCSQGMLASSILRSRGRSPTKQRRRAWSAPPAAPAGCGRT